MERIQDHPADLDLNVVRKVFPHTDPQVTAVRKVFPHIDPQLLQ